jgi:CBS domain-containing protein
MEPLELILEGKGREVYVVTPDDTVMDAVDAMCRAHVGALLVVDCDELVGIFSERDLMTRVLLARRDPSQTRVGDVMTREVRCVPADVAPREAMGIVTDLRVRHLPVVEGRRIVGVVSIGDLVRWCVRDSERQIEQLHEYVTGRYPG